MYIVIFGERDGYYGPFERYADGVQYIEDCKSEGHVVALVKPYAFGKLEETKNKIEAEKIAASVTLASEHGGE